MQKARFEPAILQKIFWAKWKFHDIFFNFHWLLKIFWGRKIISSIREFFSNDILFIAKKPFHKKHLFTKAQLCNPSIQNRCSLLDMEQELSWRLKWGNLLFIPLLPCFSCGAMGIFPFMFVFNPMIFEGMFFHGSSAGIFYTTYWAIVFLFFMNYFFMSC